MSPRRAAAFLVPLTLVLFFLLSLGIGSTSVGLADAARVLLYKSVVLRPLAGAEPDGATVAIVWDIRLPRAVLALIVGASLALAGALLQTFFRNPLAGPFVVGVSSGAAFGAVSAIVLHWTRPLAGLSPVTLCAFGGGLGVVLLVGLIYGRGGSARVETLLLTGIALGSILSAATSVLLVTRHEPLQAVLVWLLGSLASARWDHVLWILPFFVTGTVLALLSARSLNVLVWGDDVARSLGVSVRAVRAVVLLSATLLAASAVSVSGIIGFLGLMVPHIARFMTGGSHGRVLPLSLAIGGGILLASDLAARTLWAPTELPIGAITAILGAPFLAYLSNRKG